MDSQYSHQVFASLLKKEGNNICNDCLQTNPKWCSVNNAVFLCSLCARKHQQLSRDNSYIKSIEVDDWENEEILILSEGGNIRFNLTIEEYGIPLMSNPDYKYQNRASKYYRSLLLKEARNSYQVLAKPPIALGVLLIDRKSPVVYPEEVVEIIQQHKSEYASLLSDDTSVFEDSLKTIGDAFSEFKSTMQTAWDNGKFKEKFNESGQTAKKWAQNTKEFIVEKKNKVVESQVFQNIKGKTNEKIDLIKSKASELINKGNSNAKSNYSNINNGYLSD